LEIEGLILPALTAEPEVTRQERGMTIIGNDPLTQLAFSIYENKGVFALLLGSGISRAAEIPTGWEVTLDLIRRIALAQGVAEQPDWAAWYRETTGDEPNYSVLLAELASTQDERRSILHSYIEPSAEDRAEGRKTPTAAHYAIADLVRASYIKVIITTNFDRLLENALRERGVEPTVVASVDALTGAEPIAHSSCYILKLHGDYKDARILNTDEELATYSADYQRLLDRIFDEYGLVICGWSGEWDHALRAALLRAPNRRYPVYWAARGTVSRAAEEIVSHRRARTISISDADGFFNGLRHRVETLELTHRQNPLNVELLVSSTKRFLTKPEYRIQLDELFSEETERLIKKLDASEFSPQGSWSEESFRYRVYRYEAASEPLARMCGVLGRWGNDSELSLITDIVRSLYTHAEKVGTGLNLYLNMRSYPAVLVFTAYGLGLTRAGRWTAFQKFLSAIIHRENREPASAVDLLLLSAWKGGDNAIWQKLKGFDRHKTALSDHLHQLFTEWAKSFAGLSPDFEHLFERYETIAALGFLGSTPKNEVKQLLSGDQDRTARMPVGRVGWRERGHGPLIAEIQAEPLKTMLLKAGFVGGDPEFLDLFVLNFRRIADRMQWPW
jgi:hypothetical protein